MVLLDKPLSIGWARRPELLSQRSHELTKSLVWTGLCANSLFENEPDCFHYQSLTSDYSSMHNTYAAFKMSTQQKSAHKLH